VATMNATCEAFAAERREVLAELVAGRFFFLKI
jgi:hypothetical protein